MIKKLTEFKKAFFKFALSIALKIGIQHVPAKGAFTIADATSARAIKSSVSRLCKYDYYKDEQSPELRLSLLQFNWLSFDLISLGQVFLPTLNLAFYYQRGL